jgi:hypothetical protein
VALGILLRLASVACVALGWKDVVPDTRIQLVSPDGQLIRAARLATGAVVGGECHFPFRVGDIPGDGAYRFVIGEHRPWVVPAAEMVRREWHIVLRSDGH